MATPGIINGTKLNVYVDNGSLEVIGFATSCSLSITHETRNTTNQTSTGWNTRMPGNRDWEVSCDGYITMLGNASNKLNAHEMYDQYIDNRQIFTLRFGNEVNGDIRYEGFAYMTSMEMNGSNEESATYSMSFIAAGPLYQYVNGGI